MNDTAELDFVLVVGETEMRVNCQKLATISEYFRAMVEVDMIEMQEHHVKLDFLDEIGLKVIVNFANGIPATLDNGNISSVVVAASYLQVPAILDLCTKYINGNLDRDNCVDVYNLLYLFDLVIDQHRVWKYILLNFCRIPISELVKLTQISLERALCDDELNVFDEMKVFEVITAWVSANLTVDDNTDLTKLDDTKLNTVMNLFGQIKWNNMTDRDMVKITSTFPKSHIIGNNNNNCAETPRSRVYAHTLLVLSTERIRTMTLSSREKALLPADPIFQHLRQTMCDKPCVTTVDNVIYVCGGRYRGSPTASCYSYDACINEWSTLPPMSTPRSSFVLVANSDHLYVFGGTNQVMNVRACESYNIAERKWRAIAPMRVRAREMAGCLMDNKVYVSGGYARQSKHQCQDMYRYNPVSGKWFHCNSMQHGRRNHAMETIGSSIYVIGGVMRTDNHSTMGGTSMDIPVTTIEKFSKKQWTTISATMEVKQPGSFVHEGIIYVVGGKENAKVVTCLCEDESIQKSPLPFNPSPTCTVCMLCDTWSL